LEKSSADIFAIRANSSRYSPVSTAFIKHLNELAHGGRAGLCFTAQGGTAADSPNMSASDMPASDAMAADAQ
jgi:hypothetical protein